VVRYRLWTGKAGAVHEQPSGVLSLATDRNTEARTQAAGHDDVPFDPALFEGLAQLEPGHFWFEPRNHLILQLLNHYFPMARSMLEVGCGTGFVLQAIHQAHPTWQLVGSDFYEEALTYCRQRLSDVELVRADARQIPFEDQFDVVGAFDMLEYVDDDESALRQFHRALHPGGGILLTVPQHPFLWSPTDEQACHQRRYTRKGMRALLESCDFRVECMTSFAWLPFPLMLLSRFLGRLRKTRTNEDPLNGLRVSKTVNHCLRWMLEREVALSKLGLRMPFGGSLVALATRS